jgi:hypothetical protein
MYIDTKDINQLPDEINMYKKIILNKTDPIKREIFNFSELAYLTSRITPFPVNIEDYYTFIYKNLNQFFMMLAFNYISYKHRISNKHYEKIYISKSDVLYSIRFILKFFEYDNPVRSLNNSIIWIYPNYTIKRFLADCVVKKDYESAYIDEGTLAKLVAIMASFVKYEYDNIDKDTFSEEELLNFPTLVLANIKLYEKGILKLIEVNGGVGVKIDLTAKENDSSIFTKDINRIKDIIIRVVNLYENKNYSINDFID